MNVEDLGFYRVFRFSVEVRLSEDDTDYREETVYLKDIRNLELSVGEFAEALKEAYVGQLPDEYHLYDNIWDDVILNEMSLTDYLAECLQNTDCLLVK
jgi:hypothetical protein